MDQAADGGPGNTLGDRLRYARTQLNKLSMAELAGECQLEGWDVDLQVIGRIERGERVRIALPELKVLAQVLGTTVRFLVCETEDPEPEKGER